MTPANNKILVRVDLSQKEKIIIGDTVLRTANIYQPNYRIKSPTLAEVVEGNEFVRKGEVIITHHNLFYLPSPFHIEEDLFSIPFNQNIFAIIDRAGWVNPICGNVIVTKIEVDTIFPVPEDQKKYYENSYVVVNGGSTRYKKGTIVLTRPSAGYEIIYTIDNVQHNVVKVDSTMICGFIK